MELIKATNLFMLAPEAVILLTILIGILHIAFARSREEQSNTWYLAIFGTLISLVGLSLFWMKGIDPDGSWLTREVCASTALQANTGNLTVLFTADLFSMVIRTLLVLGTLLTLLFTRTYVDDRSEVPGEFYIILLSALFGGMMLSGATDMIMVFVSLETLGISSYILGAYLRGNVLSLEAGLKYLLYGSMATAILLFGFSILYALTGTTSYMGLSNLSLNPLANPLLLSLMTVMILGGIAFKLSAAPFHMWAPDVYEGAPTPVVAFLSVVSKIAAFSLALRLFSSGIAGVMTGWAPLISVMAVVSMVVGNTAALKQTNIKRLLAYSTVAHVGYILLGLIPLTTGSLGSVLYYLMAYLFMNLGAFAVVTHVENMTGSSQITSYAGLGRRHPFLAFTLTIMLLSLSGIPIMAGFFGKFFLFQAVANAGTQYLWLVGVALLTSTISLYYYLNVVRVMLVSEPDESVIRISSPCSLPVNLALTVCFVATVLLGIFSDKALLLSEEAVKDLSTQAQMTSAVIQHKFP